MLRGQVAIFLSCSEKFRQSVAWPVRDALAGHGLRAIIVSDEPPLTAGGSPEAKAEHYMDASSAFVALCAADYELSDGSMYPRANVVDEIQQALGRPHLRDRAQIVKSPGVLLPSDITPTYDSLDVTKPAVAAEVIVKQLQQWGIAAPEQPATASPDRVGAPEPATAPPEPATASPHRIGAPAADDVDALLAGPPPADQAEARRRVYPLLRDRPEDRRRWIARELCRETMEASRDARTLAAASLLQAVSALDTALVPDEMVEALAAHPRYQARACAAQVLGNRAGAAPLGVPAEILGRLAVPSAEDWLVWAPAMAAAQELVLHRRGAYVIFETLADSADARDRFAVAAALLAIAAVRPDAVARELAARLAGDADPLIAAKAAEAVQATEHVTGQVHTGE